MRIISKNELTEILKKHEMWIYGEVGGIRADLGQIRMDKRAARKRSMVN